ncbi:hypothetical protein [Nostoc sp. NMS7]|uniref:hypothetical protein n=1 Tax=Nostoc sp. NMS7 TaxID=2815391 RepID=UPI0025D4DE44|nr:hypothetical protein [Nostoc sp. NMS7]
MTKVTLQAYIIYKNSYPKNKIPTLKTGNKAYSLASIQMYYNGWPKASDVIDKTSAPEALGQIEKNLLQLIEQLTQS